MVQRGLARPLKPSHRGVVSVRSRNRNVGAVLRHASLSSVKITNPRGIGTMASWMSGLAVWHRNIAYVNKN